MTSLADIVSIGNLSKDGNLNKQGKSKQTTYLGELKMKSRKGFTLIELMVVVLIVGILAAIAIPILRGRIDAAKWSEGKSMLGSIATAIRAYHAEHGIYGDPPTTFDVGPTGLGFDLANGDLDGTYFLNTDFSGLLSVTMDPALTFLIRCDNTSGGNSGEPPTAPVAYTLDNLGEFLPIAAP